MIKLKIMAKERVERRFAVIVLGQKVAIAFDRDSGAKVGYGARMISGEIGSGGSRKNWHCYVSEGSVFEIEVDEELFNRNKNRIKNGNYRLSTTFLCQRNVRECSMKRLSSRR